MSDETEEVVKVLFDYKYSDENGQIQIKAGDIYRLIEKTNNEWWQVYDPSCADGESFFVPAQYVKIVSEKSPWKTISDFDKMLTFGLVSDKLNDHSEEEENDESLDDSCLKQSNGSNQALSQEDISAVEYTNFPRVPPGTIDEGEYVNLDQYRSAAGIPIVAAEGISGCSEDSSLSITLAKPPTVPQELIQGSIPPPLPADGKFVKILLKDQPWDIYKENTLGRLYFVNRETGERTWKPPRKALVVDQLQTPQPIVPTTSPSSVQVKEEWLGIPADYDQVHDNGSVYFIHKTTQEKWKKLVDKVGRQYYHKLGSSDTQWTLPASRGAHQNENLSQSTDSSVQYRDVNWEHQGHRLSTFGGQSMRANKARSTYGQIETAPSSRASTLPANFHGLRSTPPLNNRSQSPSTGINPQRPTNLQASNSTGLLSTSPQEAVFFSNDTYEGYLHKTKIVDVGKKKVKKNWTLIYVVLQGSNLVFYKDQKSATQKQGSPYGKPESVVSLQGAHLDLNPKELTSKKNTISLRVSAGNVYLLQSDSEKENLEWFTRMKIRANDVSPAEASPRDFDVPELKREDRRNEKGMVRSVSADDGSNLQGVDRNKNLVGIRAKLLNLISRRPTQEDLYKRGIIKDAVFGSKLQELCEREKTTVPNFVQKCIAAVESKGITHDGLYRISGNLAEIQRLRCAVDKDDTYNLCDEQWDIHVLTGALKLFFRELKEPVFPFNMYDKFFDAIKKEPRKDKLSGFKSAIANLPKCNYSTLKELFVHLCKVMDESHKNRMQTQNIAIVFGPTLLWQQSPIDSLAIQTVYQSRIVEFILLEYNELFK